MLDNFTEKEISDYITKTEGDFMKRFGFIIDYNNNAQINQLFANYITKVGYRNYSTEGNGDDMASILVECLHIGGNWRPEFTLDEEQYNIINAKYRDCIKIDDTNSEISLLTANLSKGGSIPDAMMFRLNLSISNLLFRLLSTADELGIKHISEKLNYITLSLDRNRSIHDLHISGHNLKFQDIFMNFTDNILYGLINCTNNLSNLFLNYKQINNDNNFLKIFLLSSAQMNMNYYKGPVWKKIEDYLLNSKDIPSYVSVNKIVNEPWNASCKESYWFVLNFQLQDIGIDEIKLIDIDTIYK
jgi:hypothetical protein